ncbi:uncharacterized protein OCT59_001512 [Rhizophagus irregularis]|uniref:uncharacterized protein n=1 Tax=Rhizophagus irregularis TaxID=588596 RepID=UPI00331A7459|nr:hypothetical protein OCT59_001512 [Rhizophagus irregularis]
MNEDNNLIKTWYFYFKWAGLWKAHRIGIRMGNFEMQHESLSAFAPLFPVAGKLIMPHQNTGVKYIKQNISGNPINIDQLKNQIKAVQSERDRINLFLSEFLDDNVAHQAFDNPMDNSLFKDISGLSNMTAEYTSEGWTRLFNCYSIGEERLNVILQQDILKREKRVAKGRRAKNIGHNKIANMKKSNNNNTKGRGRGGVQHVLPSNIFTTQIQILLFLMNHNILLVCLLIPIILLTKILIT